MQTWDSFLKFTLFLWSKISVCLGDIQNKWLLCDPCSGDSNGRRNNVYIQKKNGGGLDMSCVVIEGGNNILYFANKGNLG